MPGVAPRVQGVHAVMYVGENLNLNSVGTHVGTYTARIGCSTHDVFDVPLTAFHPHVQRLIPDTIASSPCGNILRLYVPKAKNGQIGDIGLVNGVYKAPGHPHVPGHGRPIYTAPADLPKYRNKAPSRPAGSLINPWTDSDSWQPGPGDRFKVTEVPGSKALLRQGLID